jgi:hypothetical protein
VFLLAQSHLHIYTVDESIDSKYNDRSLFIFTGWVQRSNPTGYWAMDVETHPDTEVMDVATMMLGWMK